MRLINAARDDALYQGWKPWVIIVCNKNPDAPQDWVRYHEQNKRRIKRLLRLNKGLLRQKFSHEETPS